MDQLRAEQAAIRKKLETIKQQRSSDARELNNMRSERDNTTEELETTRKTLEDVAILRDNAEQLLHQVGTAAAGGVVWCGVL